MGFKSSSALASVLAGVYHLVAAQNPSTTSPEIHPQLPTWKCTSSGGCVQQNTAVVLDWEYRNIHTVDGASCKQGNAANSQCPNPATCAKNCVVDGADYKAFGVSTSGNAVTMYHYVRNGTALIAASPRIYLLNGDGNYAKLSLLNQEFSVDVDLSTLPCGENGALYLSEMAASGGRNEYNPGGANYGNGYCDAQSPVLAWRNGTVNTARQGYGCNEMDIIEANSRAFVFTGHPCRGDSCDKNGCGINPYSSNKNYYGPGSAGVDTSKVFTVQMQFQASGGSLSSIVRKFIQNGKMVRSDTLSSCGTAASYGGLAGMGEALQRGMTLAMAIWNDQAGNMTWLDSGNNGPCKAGEGSPANIQAQHPDTHVIFSNIRWGDIGATSKS